jgi:hypothetical protein
MGNQSPNWLDAHRKLRSKECNFFCALGRSQIRISVRKVTALFLCFSLSVKNDTKYIGIGHNDFSPHSFLFSIQNHATIERYNVLTYTDVNESLNNAGVYTSVAAQTFNATRTSHHNIELIYSLYGAKFYLRSSFRWGQDPLALGIRQWIDKLHKKVGTI